MLYLNLAIGLSRPNLIYYQYYYQLLCYQLLPTLSITNIIYSIWQPRFQVKVLHITLPFT